MNEWHYEQNDQAIGPLPESQLIDAFRSGQIAADTLVWNPRMSDWLPLSKSPLASRIQNFKPAFRDQLWSYERDGETISGVTQSQVEMAYLRGEIDENNFVLIPGASEWVSLAESKLAKSAQRLKPKGQTNTALTIASWCMWVKIVVLVVYALFVHFIEESDSALTLVGVWCLILFLIGAISSLTAFIQELNRKPKISVGLLVSSGLLTAIYGIAVSLLGLALYSVSTNGL